MSYICKEEALNVLLNKIRDVTGTSCEKDRSGLCVAYYLISKEIPSADVVSREFYEDAVKANTRLVIENRELKEQIESADRPSGEWLRQDKYFQAFNETVTTYKCSVCEHEPYFGGDISKLNYCPNCGAYMKGGDTE